MNRKISRMYSGRPIVESGRKLHLNVSPVFARTIHVMWMIAQVRELCRLVGFGILALLGAGLLIIAVVNSSAADGPVLQLATAAITAVPATCRKRRRERNRDLAEAGGKSKIAASYARFSSDMQRDESNADQQRKCRDAAVTNGHDLRPEFEYADQAISGTKRNRDGLNAMLRDAEKGKFQLLYVYSLSRLARESVISLPMIKQLVHVYGIQFVSVTEGIDSSRDGWELTVAIYSVMAENFIKELGKRVFCGQEGTVLANFSVGDYCFGYTSVPIPGSEAGRRGRHAKPRMTYAIHDVNAAWVVRIFHWFVAEQRTLRWITRELNRRGAPKDHRSTTTEWHHTYVARLLANQKYIGVWSWGETQNNRDPFSGQISQEPRDEQETEKYTRQFPHLRLIDDAMFHSAQVRLEENFRKHAATRRENGMLAGSRSDSATPRHLLSQLVRCGECQSRFIVSGTSGKYLLCARYLKGLCTCKTQLRRDRAERLILQEIGSRILTNGAWFKAVMDAFLMAWRQCEAQLPDQLASVKRELADVELKIDRLIDRVELGDRDPDITRRLTDRRHKRDELSTKLADLQNADAQRLPPPTNDWLREQLAHLEAVLSEASPTAVAALRNLVGGQIAVTEVRKEGRKRHHLRGEFTIQVTSVARAMLEASGSTTVLEQGELQRQEAERIVIDFVDPSPLDGPAEQAKALYDDGLINTLIAVRMKCSKSRVTKLLQHWFESRGLEMPNGWKRRGSLAVKHAEPPMFQQIAPQAMELWRDGRLMQDIAAELDCDRTTVRAAIDFWHESNGVPSVDGRSRHAQLERFGGDKQVVPQQS